MKKLVVYFLTGLMVVGLSIKTAHPAPGKEKEVNILAEAKKEGKITIYGQVGPELRVALTKALKDELGLDLELIPGKGREVATRYSTELRAGIPSADILMGGASTFRADPDLYTF